jgi:hypothetical protein
LDNWLHYALMVGLTLKTKQKEKQNDQMLRAYWMEFTGNRKYAESRTAICGGFLARL